MEDRENLERASTELIREREDNTFINREFNSDESFDEPPMDDNEQEAIERTFLDGASDVGAMVIGAAPRNINRATKALFDIGALGKDIIDGESTEEEQRETMRSANNMWKQFAKAPLDIGVAEDEEGVAESTSLGIMQELGDYLIRFGAGAAATPGNGVAKAVGGLVTAGFTSDNDEMSILETIVGMLPEDENTKAIKEGIKQDPEKPSGAVTRRAIKAAEDIGLGLTVDKAVGAAAEAIGKPAINFLGEVPGVLGGMAARAFANSKNFLYGQTDEVGSVTIKQIEKGNIEQGGMNLKLDEGAVDPEKPVEDQVGKIFTVDAAGDGPKLTSEAQGKAVEGIKKKIVEIVEKERKTKGTATNTAFQKQVREAAAQKNIGKKEAEQLTKKANSERLDAVAEQQAANILLDTTVARFSATSRAAKRAQKSGNSELAGALKQKSLDRLDEIIQTGVPFYQAVSGKAGAVLRQTQEVGTQSRKIIEMVNDVSADDVKAGTDAFNALKDDPVARQEIVDKMSNSIDMTKALGGSSEDSAAAVATALGKVGKGQTNASKLWKAFESSYINGILSSPKTHVLNFTSSEAMAMTLIAERGIASAIPGSGVKFKEAQSMLNEFMRSNLEGVMAATSGATAAARAGVGNGSFKVNVKSQRELLEQKGLLRKGGQFATPGFTKGERAKLLSTEKFEEGLEPTAFSGKAFNQEGSIGKTIDMLGHTVGSGWVRDMMAYQDNFVKTMMIRAEQRAFINRKVFDEDELGLSEVLKKGDLDDKKLRDQVEEMIGNGGDDFNFESKFHELGLDKKTAKDLAGRAERVRLQSVEQAAESALTSTFQKRLGPKMESARKLLQDSFPGGRLLVPFVTSPVSLMSEQLKRLPVLQVGESAASVGLPIHPQFYKDFVAGGRRRADAVAKFTTGNALFQLGAQMFATEEEIKNGQEAFITPARSNASTGERQFLPDSGLQEMAFVGDEETFQFMQYAPLAPMVLTGAQMKQQFGNEIFDVIDQLNDDDFSEVQTKYMALMSSQAMYFNDLPLLRGPADITKLVGQAERGNASFADRAGEFVARKAAAAVPASSMLAWLGRQDDKYLRDMSEFTDFIKDRLPGWRKDLPVSRDALYEKRELGGDMFGPFAVNTKTLKKDPLRAEMIDVGAFPERPGRKVKISADPQNDKKIEVELTKDEMDELGSLFDTQQYNLKPKLLNVINSSEYKNMTTKDKRQEIMNNYRQFVSEAVNDYATMNPEVYERYNRFRLADELLEGRKGEAAFGLGAMSEQLREKE